MLNQGKILKINFMVFDEEISEIKVYQQNANATGPFERGDTLPIMSIFSVARESFKCRCF